MNSSAPHATFRRAGDFADFRSFPAVIQSADVRALREAAAQDSGAALLQDFCGGYLGYDDRARHALESSLKALGSRGGAFFFNGVFGSGKSHLLGLLALLADGAGWTPFLEAHPHLRPLQSMPARLVVHFSLDDWSAAEHSLEAICRREIEAEWQRRFGEQLSLFSEEGMPAGARGEVFGTFLELCGAKGLDGCALFIDELSLFLGGRAHHLLQQDAAWLQFLGQRARLNRGFLAVFAALQKTVEDIGDVDGYAISQIRDRFTTLPLSLAHLPSLIERRLVQRKDVAALQRFNSETYDGLARMLPRLDFGREDWDRAFPFHPATVGLLEQIAPRYFSRTRSAALFCQRAAKPGAPAAERVLPPTLFDDIVDELPLHPDLKPIHTAWLHWQGEEKAVARDAGEAAHLRDCFKALALWRIAGSAPTVTQVVNSLLLSSGLSGDAAYEYGRLCLEKLRAHAPVVVERQSGDFQDRYALDFGTRVSDLARRFTGNALANLGPRDGRIARYALSCARDEALPLATLDATSPTPLWRNAPRRADLFVAAGPPAPDVLANRIAALAAPGGMDWLLFLVPPFGEADPQRWREAVREGVVRAGVEARWRGAVAWWLPREASDDEWAQAREATAQHSLLHDPQLSDNRRGRAVLEYLKGGLAEREAGLGRIVVRLLFEGTLVSSAGAVIDGGELAAGSGGWGTTLEAVADWTLGTAFPRWPEIAPRARVLTEGNAQTLALEVLRRPVAAPYFAASHERLVRAIAEPLGIARGEAGRWRIAEPRAELLAFFTDFVAASKSATLSTVEAHAAKSEWGLSPELTRLCLCALLRGGELVGLDTRGQAVAPEEIGLPLGRSIRTVEPGALMDAANWEAVRAVVAAFCGSEAGPQTYAAQQAARATLTTAREEWRANAELFSARLHQLRRALGGDWRGCEAALEGVTRLLHALDGDALAAATRFEIEATRASLDVFRDWSETLDARASMLVEAQLFLGHPHLAAPVELAESRAALMNRLAEGEAALRDEALQPAFEAWRTVYGDLYITWHRAQNDPVRLRMLQNIATGDGLRALEAWDTLPSPEDKLAPAVRTALRQAAGQLCPREGHPAREPVCASCRLRLGEAIAIDSEAVNEALETARQAVRQTLKEKCDAELLKFEAAGELVCWLDKDESLEKLWPLLGDGALRGLAGMSNRQAEDNDIATVPLLEAGAARRVPRSFAELRARLIQQRSRGDAEQAFREWLDGTGGLGPADEIEWVE